MFAETVDEAKVFLQKHQYDAIFSTTKAAPHHYESNAHTDFENTGYEIARWLNEIARCSAPRRSSSTRATLMPPSEMVRTLRESGAKVETAHSRCRSEN